ncbi:MAG: TRAP transporter small permease [Propionibacteriaceae bacterium]|jgi:TRAP-type C4-dicarboxylate transport system permease small subunit|nr:TRAP transporter small permease [Propionibacteriaceae bacterium]
MTIMASFKKGLGVTLRVICVTLFAAMTLLVIYQVLQRQVVLPLIIKAGGAWSGIAWTEAAGRYCFIWLGLLGAAYVIGEKDDVAIDFLVRKFPPLVSRIVQCVAHVVVAFFAGWVMIYGGWQFVVGTWDQRVELMPFSQGQLYTVLVIAGGLIVIYCLMHIVETFTRPVVARDESTIDVFEMDEEAI